MPSWIQDNQALLYWLTGASVLLFIGTLVVVPIVVVRIEPDYFTHDRRPTAQEDSLPGFRRIALIVAKNALGVLLILAGIAMLVLPGQGVLTMILGFLLLDFPGKYRAEKWLISRSPVLKSINWIRRRRGVEPLRTDSTK